MFGGTGRLLSLHQDDAPRRGSFLGMNFQLTSRGSIQLVEGVDQRLPLCTSETFVSGRRVKILIRGELFETFEETLMKFPDTLLGSRRKRRQHYQPEKDAYVFEERNKFAFNAILFFYQSGGILAKPEDVPFTIFTRELEFFELVDYFPACWTLKAVPVELPKSPWQKTLWSLFQDPKSSTVAMLFSWISFSFIVITTAIFCFETTKIGYLLLCKNNGTVPNVKAPICVQNTEWFIVDSVITAWFVLEYAAGLLTAQRKVKFVFSFLGVIDLLSILPYFGILFLDTDGEAQFHMRALRLLRFTRVIRVLKLAHHIEALRLLGYTIKQCLYLLVGLMLLVAILTISLSSLIYFAEKDLKTSSIKDSPDAAWFVIITLTNVGYGDVVPASVLGKMVGAITTILGILIVFILPAPVLLNHFEEIYSLRKERKKLKDAGIKIDGSVADILQNIS
ncbi:potassium voltage-gated channel subfamily A member 6-like [Dendronephthya gigantea]|uniref:potassium voltage-gated channel subfamily A member 6-like n=1 Tax=Dendronephthya gigantea TaxID=151771 RepID=UPI00106A74F7|nr:potassium voltage-gated channel subfamily A member 6-like [Dendronephthya gigantea]